MGELIWPCGQVLEKEYDEIHMGWVSLLMTLKVSVDFQTDSKNHHGNRICR